MFRHLPQGNFDGESIVKYLIAALSVLFVGAWSPAYASDQEGLQLELTPYFWAPGIDGKIERGTRDAHFNESFSDLIQHVDAGFMGLGVVSYDRFVLYADYDYVSLSDDGTLKRDLIFPPGTKTKLDGSIKIGTYAGGYRFDTFGNNWVDVMFGAQLTDLGTGLKVAGSNFSNNRSLTDTVVMLRPTFNISERWRFNPTFAYGISGDSDTTYQLSPQIEFKMTDSFDVRFGYKRVYWENKNGNSGTPNFDELHTSLSGFILGVGWNFPAAHKKEVVAPPPPPAAKPVAAAPVDSDGDGVPDSIDRCPNTPRGTKVDAYGCPLPAPAPVSFDLTVEFAFNSSEINDLSFRELRKAMTFMREHPDTTAVVEGNTDNKGTEEYNQKLSERRAAAVKDVLVKSGIDASRLSTIGYGETRPVASNDTEAGRAKNRRVSIVVK